MLVQSNTTMNLIRQRLLEIFPNIVPYSEAIPPQSLFFPNFHIQLIQLTINRQLSDDLYFVNYFYTIKYRHANEPTLVTNLAQQLDNVGFALMTEFKHLVTPEGVHMRLRDQYYTKADGDLNFFFNLRFLIKKEEVEEVKMQNLHLNIIVLER